MIRFFITGLLCICTVLAWGQGRDSVRLDSTVRSYLTLTGQVVGGSDKELLPGAYIYLGETRRPVTTTNEKGLFLIPKLSAGKVRISVSYIGYQTYSTVYDLDTNTNIGKICLQPVILDEVEIKAVPPLAVRQGDTTRFNMAALKIAVDADLEELLKKLPGFEIVDGKIIAQGKEVTKLYIDGMEYSFNDPGAALKNLPAKLVARIKMYDDRSEEAKFSGYDDGKKFRSLNIETHDPNQLKVFGRTKAGYGITDPLKNTFRENNYQAALSANLFDQKRKVTISGDMRNDGNNNKLPDSHYQGAGGDNNSHALYTNLSLKLGKNVMFSGNYRFSGHNSYSATSTKQVYFPTDRYQNRIYDSENHSWGDGMNHSMNVYTEIRLNEKNSITFSPVFSASENNSKALSISGNIQDNDTISTSDMLSKDKSSMRSVGGNLLWMHAFRKKGRTFTFRADGNYNRNLSDQSQNNLEGTLNDENTHTDTLKNLLMTNRRTGYRWNVSVTWSEPLTEHARLGLNYSYRENTDYSDKMSMSYRDKGFEELIGIDTAQTNQLQNVYRVHSYGVNYNYYFKKLRFNGGFSISNTLMDNRYKYLGQVDSLMQSVYTDIFPNLNLSIELKENRNLDISYFGNSSSPNSGQLQNVLDISNPLQVYKGNPVLKKSYHHSVTMNYSGSVSEKSVFYYSALTLGQTLNQITSNVKFLERDTVINGYTLIRGARYTTPVNLNGDWNASVNMNYSFPLEKLKLRMNLSLSYRFSHSPSIYDDLKNLTNTHSSDLGINVNTNISDNFDFNISAASAYSYSRNSTTGGSQYFNETIQTGIRWIFWEGFFTNVNYNGSFYINKKGETFNQSKHILNAGIGKKWGKNRNMELALHANDMLNQRNTMNYSLNDLYSETSFQTMPSSYYLLSFSYRFNSMDKKKEDLP